MQIARTIATRVHELRLQQALQRAHRARLQFLREDYFDGDCDRCVRRVRAAEERVNRLEAMLRAARHGEPLRN